MCPGVLAKSPLTLDLRRSPGPDLERRFHDLDSVTIQAAGSLEGGRTATRTICVLHCTTLHGQDTALAAGEGRTVDTILGGDGGTGRHHHQGEADQQRAQTSHFEVLQF